MNKIDRFTSKAGIILVIITLTYLLAHLFALLMGVG